MKFLIKSLLVGSLSCVAAANADVEGVSNNISPIKKISTGSSHQINVRPVPVSFMKVQSICPPDAKAKCPLVGSLVTLSFNVPCYAKLGPVSSQLIEQKNGVRALAVSAVVYDDVQPGQFRCQSIMRETVSKSLPNEYLTETDYIDLNTLVAE